MKPFTEGKKQNKFSVLKQQFKSLNKWVIIYCHRGKTTSDGRQPQNIKNGISQQPLIRSFSNVNLKLRGANRKNDI